MVLIHFIINACVLERKWNRKKDDINKRKQTNKGMERNKVNWKRNGKRRTEEREKIRWKIEVRD